LKKAFAIESTDCSVRKNPPEEAFHDLDRKA
jgi:hypothetical protein